MWQSILKPVRKMIEIGKHSKNLSNVYRIKIINKSKNVIWLAKNTVARSRRAASSAAPGRKRGRIVTLAARWTATLTLRGLVIGLAS